MSLTKHQYFAGGIFHDVLNYWINLLHVPSHAHRSIGHKDQVYSLLFCFAHNGCSCITCFQYAFSYSSSIPDPTTLSYRLSTVQRFERKLFIFLDISIQR